ncbi:hypothetical protein BDQ17DRAFT_197937 [Cyathus striatus]|nr:hypothetical protein BDQ17DRAFT_197937 [Cyathus striatus]
MSSPSNFPLIPEIIKLIFEQLATDEYTLASLARTCRVFEDPALDVLWRELSDGFYQLVKCLPAHVWEEDEREDIQYVVLKQPIASADCFRFTYYARRVRRYTFNPESSVQVDASIYQALQLVMPCGEKLLPNVQKLTWDCEENTLPFIHMFLGPRLIKIDFVLSLILSPLELSLISAVYEHCPLLESVSISFPSSIRDVLPISHIRKAVEIMSSSIHKWEKLRSLVVETLTYSAFLEVSRLPRLEELVMQHCEFDVDTSHSTPRGGFPMLKSLKALACFRASDCISMMKAMDDSQLHSLTVVFAKVITSASWKQVFLTLAQHCCHDSLSDIVFWDRMFFPSVEILTHTRQEMVNFGALEPLLAFFNLQSFRLEVTKGIYFSDPSEIKKIATSWPKVQVLKLKPRFFSRGDEPSSITVVDLLTFVEHCPRLTQLGITFDAISPPEINRQNIFWNKTWDSNILELYVGDSPIRNPTLFAATLSGVFPYLKKITTIEEEEEMTRVGPLATGTNHNAWKQVEELMKLFSAVRDQERSSAST